MPTRVTIRTGPAPPAPVPGPAAGLNRGMSVVSTRTVSTVSAAPPNRAVGYSSGCSPRSTVRASAYGTDSRIVVNRKCGGRR